jgi:hypothetical protein
MAATISVPSECEPVIALDDDYTCFWQTRVARMNVSKRVAKEISED